MSEGGNIIRIIGGQSTWTSKQNLDLIATDGDVSIGSPTKVNIEGIDGGQRFGAYDYEENAGKYFAKGWWSSDFEGNEKITKAKIGDIVYFHVEMTEKFPNAKLGEKKDIISFQLFEFDGNRYSIGYIYFFGARFTLDKEPQKGKKIPYITWVDSNNNKELDAEEEHTKKPYSEVRAKGIKAVISFQLSEGLRGYFNKIALLQLFMSVSYDGETLLLPESEKLYLDVDPNPKIKEIYVRLLNYQPPQNIVDKLKDVGGYIQSLQGNDDKQSEKVNMDYFSVRIDQLPTFAKNDIKILYKKIRDNFLTLSKGNVPFESHIEPFRKNITGRWQFKPYSKNGEPIYETKQLENWKNEKGGTIIFIEAGGGIVEDWIGDHGAVLESESEFSEMCWIFTTIFTEKSKTQPFSGHRQFGIHKDEEGCYRFYARAIDRIWPSSAILNASLNRKDMAVKDYLTIADSTWRTLIKNVSDFIIKNGGSTTIMQPEMDRVIFKDFNEKYYKTPIFHIGNIPQYNEINEDEI